MIIEIWRKEKIFIIFILIYWWLNYIYIFIYEKIWCKDDDEMELTFYLCPIISKLLRDWRYYLRLQMIGGRRKVNSLSGTPFHADSNELLFVSMALTLTEILVDCDSAWSVEKRINRWKGAYTSKK